MRSHQTSLAREPVPGAGLQAIIAAVDPGPNRGTQFDRNGALQLNCQVGDAEPRVELERRNNGIRRASGDTASAVAAPIVFGRIRLDFEGGDDFRDQGSLALGW